MNPPRIGRAFRVAMMRQALAVAAIAALSAMLAGTLGLLSALVGGSIGIVGLLVFALLSSRVNPSAGGAVRTALRAEAAKIVAVVLLLWLSFSVFRDMVVFAFMAAFIVSVFLSGLAFAVSEK
jgi:ATP synthase protein I